MHRIESRDFDFLLDGEIVSPPKVRDEFTARIVEHLLRRVRIEFYQEYAIAQMKTLRELLDGRVIKWDGGCYKNGTRVEPVWPRLLRLLVETEAAPEDFIAAQYRCNRDRCPSSQEELLSLDAQRRHSMYMASRTDQPLHVLLNYAHEMVPVIAQGSIFAGASAKGAWHYALGLGSSDFSYPLVTYALAKAAGLDGIAAANRVDALEIVVFRRSYLLQHIPELVGDELLADVDRIRVAILTSTEENQNG